MLESLILRHIGQIDAIAVYVELPAMVGTAQSALLIATEKEPDQFMWAISPDDTESPVRIAECNEIFAQDAEPQRRPIDFQLCAEGGRGSQ